jgi:hypothetical protein
MILIAGIWDRGQDLTSNPIVQLELRDCLGVVQVPTSDQTSECMDVKLMQGKILGVQVLESYSMKVSCGQDQGIKVLSFRGVVELLARSIRRPRFEVEVTTVALPCWVLFVFRTPIYLLLDCDLCDEKDGQYMKKKDCILYEKRLWAIRSVIYIVPGRGYCISNKAVHFVQLQSGFQDYPAKASY